MNSIYVSRRKLIWQKLKSPETLFSFWIATASGAGLFPVAPGTAGTVAALPVVYFTQSWSWPNRILFWTLLTLVGIWSAKVFDETMETHDNQNIVIDEVIGFGIAAWTVGESLSAWLVAFLAFRFFDGLKPPPIRHIDQWSKKQTSPWWDGFGVIADDIVAGIQSLMIVGILQWLRILG